LSNIAIIPARGGSKRIPNKNVRPFFGKPMIAWSIELAKRSGLFERIIVSTDSDQIASVARAYDAEIPFARPALLADDHTPTLPVISHAISFLTDSGVDCEYVCCIYPCVPFLTHEDLLDGFELLGGSHEDFSYAVAHYPHPIQRSLLKLDDGRMSFLMPEYEQSRTQDLPVTYHDLGQFYWGHADHWISKQKIHSGGFGLQLPYWRFVDIDSEDDWKRAELLFSTMYSK